MKKYIYLIPLLLTLFSCDNRTYEEKTSNYNNLIESALIKIDSSNYQMAIVDLNEAIKITDTLSTAFFQRAVSYYLLNDYENSIDDLSEVINIEGEKSKSYKYRAQTYRKLQELDDFKDDIDVYINHYDNDKESYIWRGEYYANNNDFEDAIKDYTKALLIDSSDPEIYLLRGNIYSQIGDNKKGLNDFDKYIVLKADSIDLSYVHYKKGLLHNSIDKPYLAINDFSKTSSRYRVNYLNSKYEKEELARMLQTSEFTLKRISEGKTDVTPEFSETVMSLVNKTIKNEDVTELDPVNSLSSVVFNNNVWNYIWIIMLSLIAFSIWSMFYKKYINNSVNEVLEYNGRYAPVMVSKRNPVDINKFKVDSLDTYNKSNTGFPFQTIIIAVFIVITLKYSTEFILKNYIDTKLNTEYVSQYEIEINPKQEITTIK